MREREDIRIELWLLFPVRKLLRLQMLDDGHLSFLLSFISFHSLLTALHCTALVTRNIHHSSSSCCDAVFDRDVDVTYIVLLPRVRLWLVSTVRMLLSAEVSCHNDLRLPDS